MRQRKMAASSPPSAPPTSPLCAMAVSLQPSCAAALHTRSAPPAAAAAIKRLRCDRRFMMAAGCRNSLQCRTSIAVIVTTGEGSMSSQGRAPNRRVFLQSAAAASLLIASGARAQTTWPDRMVRIVVPYPPGGSTDVLARILAERLNQIYGQPFMIENRPGAGGNIGIGTVTGSTPDGYTVGAATIGHFAINQFLYASMPYDPERDMIPATLTWDLTNVFVVASDHVPAKTVAEFLAWAKQKGNVSFCLLYTSPSPRDRQKSRMPS